MDFKPGEERPVSCVEYTTSLRGDGAEAPPEGGLCLEVSFPTAQCGEETE